MNKKMLLVIAGLAVVSLLIGVMLGTHVKRMKRSDKADAAGSNAKSEQNATEIELSQSAVHKNDESAQQPVESSDETITGAASVSDGGSSDAGVGQNISGTDSAAGPDADVNLQTEPAPAEYVSKDSANYTYEQMMEDLEEMSAAYPSLITVNICGTSLDGRAIPEAIIGNRESTKHIFIQASIHAREHINTLLAMAQIEQLLVHHADGVYVDASYDELLSQVCFHILPMSNPDGVTISQMGIDGIRDEGLKEILRGCYQNDLDNGRTSSDIDSYWRKWKANARGVDLNRNFDAGWETYEGVSYPSSDHYKGDAPVSEPETQAIVNAVHACGAVLTISYHSTGSLIYWDYGSNGEVYEADAMLANIAQAITGYSAVSSVQSSQDAAGCSDYFVLKEGTPSVTIENGYSECPIGIEEFPSIWNSNAELLPALALNYR